MRILILGGGEVGSTVAKTLANQAGNTITIIDQDESIIQSLNDILDIQTMVGNAASPMVLSQAGAADADLLLALTGNDETNLTACVLGKRMFNIPSRIARIRHGDIVEYLLDPDAEGVAKPALSLFDVNAFICPEQLITEQMIELFRYNTALQVVNFVGGMVQMVVTRVRENADFSGKLLNELNDILPEGIECRVFAIYRNNSLIILSENTKLIRGDEVFLMAKKEQMHVILPYFDPQFKPAQRIMIAGGGNIGYRLAKRAEKQFSVKIIQRSGSRAAWLAENLSATLVLEGLATDEKLLEQEHVGDTDVFCAFTNDDEDNIMSALLAKSYGAERVIAIVNRPSYVDLLQGNTIDIVVSPHLTTIGSILAHIRRGDIVSVHPLRRGEAEIIEAVIHGTRKTSKIVGRPFSQIQWPHGCQITAIVRGGIFIPLDESAELEEGDHVIFFVSRRQTVHELEKMLQVKVGFFG
ncbi:MAG: Trk system potassium transporter TrkA [Neisseriaceae bacterium]|nr:Trk system potassium transporter TrkA [Neisseriaceae bacterium]